MQAPMPVLAKFCQRKVLSCRNVLDGLDDIGEKEDIKRNQEDGHINEGIFAVNAVDHGNAHEADIGKDDHDVDDAVMFLGIPKNPR